MKTPVKKLLVGSTLVVGVGLWGGFAQHFNKLDKLSYEPNIATIKGSPYGKVLALAMQGPIDFYWHQGQTHEHASILNNHVHDENCTDCGSHGEAHGHDHSGHGHAHHHHGHDHGHDHHGHDHTAHAGHEHGEGCGCGAHGEHEGHDHGAVAHEEEHEHDENCGCGAHGDPDEQSVVKKDKAFHLLAKDKIKAMAAMAHRKTDGKPLSQAHQKYLQEVTEKKLRLAYELDPSNYTNYGNYHLFIATTTYGASDADDDAAVALARRTLDFCKKEEVDPAVMLTASSAAYNIIYHIGRYHEQFTVKEAKASLAEFDECMAKFNLLLDRAVAEGRIASEERLKEMHTRAKYMNKLREAQGAYMKRMMSNKMATSQANTKKGG